jgi:hypothetical protein
VIRGTHKANVSVCTDQKPSESDGAITQSTFATNALNSSLLNPFQILTLHLSLLGRFIRFDFSFSLI